MSAYTKKVDGASFDREVIEGSADIPVLVDFWASWCAPCRALEPILEKLAEEYGGRFVLAKVNTDENPELASRYGVRGIPNVKAFVGGKIVAEFNGTLPEPAVRGFLEKLVPTPAEKLRLAALKEISQGSLESGERRLQEALSLEPGHREARLDLVGALIARKAYEEAGQVLQDLPERDRDDRAEHLAKQIDLWKKVRELPSVPELRAALARSPENLDLRLQLGEQLVIARDFEGAMGQLIEVVRGDQGKLRERARELFLEVFKMAGDQGDLVGRYRRLLASAIY